MIDRETVYSDGGSYQKPKWQEQAEQDNAEYKTNEAGKIESNHNI